ncbi:MAG: 1-acyl-sn-glycerol-3-phosphate acyltransferase [Sandaracinaceae bacterium]|nr:1-acyl-sn-glycerol-3-phosphate acyltransferase [Myxococcales bacterium]MCB9658797.1 1-acyl-sn-glycerol-3-phosphate acyltransferase [Sandaracinaceae bacterium]
MERNVNRLPIPFDAHGVDPFGVDKEWLIRAYSPFASMYRRYLNVTTFGMEHVPKTGRGLLIGNHSGGIGADAAMTMTSLLMNHDAPRLAHGMAEYFFNTWPFASQLMNRTGHLTGLPEHAEMLLGAGRIVVAFPEGARGTAKLYRDRYKLVRFGTGFVRLALKTKTPVYPFAFIGGEEAFPTMFHIKGLNKLIGAPYVPVAPQLVIWPLPVSCQIHFGPPLHFEGDGSETDEVIQGYVDRVRDAIADLIQKGLAARPAAFTRQRVDSPYDPTRPELKR